MDWNFGFPLREQKESEGRESCRENTKREMKQSNNRREPSGVKSGGEFSASHAGNLLGDALFYELGPYSFEKTHRRRITGTEKRRERKRKRVTGKEKDDDDSGAK